MDKTKEEYNYFLDDNEIDKEELDLFHSKDITDNIKKIIFSKTPPFNIGIFGNWGTGKSSIIKLLEKDKEFNNKERFQFVKINVWKYSKGDLLRNFIENIIQQLKIKKEIREEIAKNLFYDIEKIDLISKKPLNAIFWILGISTLIFILSSIFPYISPINYHAFIIIDKNPQIASDQIEKILKVKDPGSIYRILAIICRLFAKPYFTGLVGIIISIFTGLIQIFSHKITKTKIESLDDFEKKFKDIIEDFLGENSNLKIIIFLDDLDRCPPAKMIEVLETIKTFLDIHPCIFIIACDDTILIKAIDSETERNFKGVFDNISAGEDYLEKVFQYTFRIPPYDTIGIREYAKKIIKTNNHFLSQFKDDLDPIVKILIPSNTNSPRKVKKLINEFSSIYLLLNKRKGAKLIKLINLNDNIEQVKLLAKISVIKVNHLEFYYDLIDNPNIIDIIIDLAKTGKLSSKAEISDDILNKYFKIELIKQEDGSTETKYIPLKKKMDLINYLSANSNVMNTNLSIFIRCIEDERVINFDTKMLRDLDDMATSGNILGFETEITQQKDINMIYERLIDVYEYNKEEDIKSNVILTLISSLHLLSNINDQNNLKKICKSINYSFSDIIIKKSFILDVKKEGLFTFLNQTKNQEIIKKCFEIFKDVNTSINIRKEILLSFIKNADLVNDYDFSNDLELRSIFNQNKEDNVSESTKKESIVFELDYILSLLKIILENKTFILIEKIISEKTFIEILGYYSTNTDAFKTIGLELNDIIENLIQYNSNKVLTFNVFNFILIEPNKYSLIFSKIYENLINKKIFLSVSEINLCETIFSNYKFEWDANIKNIILDLLLYLFQSNIIFSEDSKNLKFNNFFTDFLWNNLTVVKTRLLIEKIETTSVDFFQTIKEILKESSIPDTSNLSVKELENNYNFYINKKIDIEKNFSFALITILRSLDLIKSEEFNNFWKKYINYLFSRDTSKNDIIFKDTTINNIYHYQNNSLEKNKKLEILYLITINPQIYSKINLLNIFNNILFPYFNSDDFNDIIMVVNIAYEWREETNLFNLNVLTQISNLLIKEFDDKWKLLYLLIKFLGIIKSDISKVLLIIETFLNTYKKLDFDKRKILIELILNQWNVYSDDDKNKLIFDEALLNFRNNYLDTFLQDIKDSRLPKIKLYFYASIIIGSDFRWNFFAELCDKLLAEDKPPEFLKLDELIVDIESDIQNDKRNRNLLTIIIKLKSKFSIMNNPKIIDLFNKMLINDDLSVNYVALDTIKYYLLNNDDFNKEQKTNFEKSISSHYNKYDGIHQKIVKDLADILDINILQKKYQKKID